MDAQECRKMRMGKNNTTFGKKQHSILSLLAPGASPFVHADGAAAALLALGSYPFVHADGAATALLAPGAYPFVHADGAAAALLALGASPFVHADGAAAALRDKCCFFPKVVLIFPIRILVHFNAF